MFLTTWASPRRRPLPLPVPLSSQQTELSNYINYFLLNSGTAPPATEKSPATVDVTSWAPWDVPNIA